MTRRALEDFASKRLATVPKSTVWNEMTPLAMEYKAINLGQGFPTFAPPPFVSEHLAATATQQGAPLNHQYARPLGNLELVAQLQRLYKDRLQRESIGLLEVLVTNGVTQGLNLACQAFLGDGDELVTFEPFFDLYMNDVQMAGANVQLVPMQTDLQDANKWTFCEDVLRSKISSKTKAILVNTPQNVPGKVWSLAELEIIAKIAVEHDLLVFSDEVYTTLVYDGHKHISMASLPGMWERTLTFCSAGKTFSCTGWKIGWIVAPAPLIVALNQVQAHQSFSIATPLQIAVARSLADAETNGYYETMLSSMMHRRQLLMDILVDAGLTVVRPAGGYFALADISRVAEEHYFDAADMEFGRDWQFCRWMTKVIGVNAIPVSAFCTAQSRPMFEKFVRFAFCKTEEDIREAGVRLQKLKNYFRQ